MKRETYIRILGFWKKTPFRETVLRTIGKGTPYAMAALYLGTAVWLAVVNPWKLILFCLIPLGVFLLVSLLRYHLNYPRPFEELGFEPLIPHSKGESFPSRHTASAFILACACTYASPWLAIPGFILAAVAGLSRFLLGVHYPRDVLCGAAISLLLGWLCFGVLASQIGWSLGVPF